MTCRDDDRLIDEMTAAIRNSTLLEPSRRDQHRGTAQNLRMTASSNEPFVASHQQQQPQPQRSFRPFDSVMNAGPAADPIEFPRPQMDRGRRGDVLVYNQLTQSHDVAKNVLFRDYSRMSAAAAAAAAASSLPRDEDLDHHVQTAYWPLPYKQPIKTIMGHLSICLVLTRCTKERDDDSGSDDVSEEEDVVFQMTNRLVAIKVNYCDRMERMRRRHAEDPLKEIAALQIIGRQHPNVMGCIEVLFDGANVNVVLPYCGSGDLFQLLQDHQRMVPTTPGLSEAKARYWFRQIMAGLQYLHKIGICHRDLSPENIMIDGKNLLIIDMGMCLRMPFTDPTTPHAVTDARRGTQRRLVTPQGQCGKLPYMSPEIYKNQDNFDGCAVDVWTAGTILFCMITGNRSYQKPYASDPQFYWMTHHLPTLLRDWRVNPSEECVDLLQKMLQVDPRPRLSVDEVLAHPWFSHPDDPTDIA